MKVEAHVTEMEFEQPTDCCSDRPQFLRVKQENGGIERDDHFYVLETERWAFDSIDEFVELLRKAGCRERRSDDEGSDAE